MPKWRAQLFVYKKKDQFVKAWRDGWREDDVDDGKRGEGRETLEEEVGRQSNDWP